MIFEHVSLTVSHLEKSIDFYTKVFGYNLLRKTPTHAYLYLGNDLLELMQSEVITTVKKPKPLVPGENWMKYVRNPIGLNHIGFRVDDLDKIISKIQKLGGELIVPPQTHEPNIEYVTEPIFTDEKLKRAARPTERPYWRIALFSDPDGIIFEIIER